MVSTAPSPDSFRRPLPSQARVLLHDERSPGAARLDGLELRCRERYSRGPRLHPRSLEDVDQGSRSCGVAARRYSFAFAEARRSPRYLTDLELSGAATLPNRRSRALPLNASPRATG